MQITRNNLDPNPGPSDSLTGAACVDAVACRGEERRRRCRRALRTLALLLAATLTLSFAAYGGNPTPAASSQQSSSAKASQPSAAPASTSPTSSRGASVTRSTPIRVVIGKRFLAARLSNNATARSLIARLPLTLRFSDYNGLEKIAHLRKRLSMRGMPKSADPKPRDIGYYAPWGNLVFYYGDVGRYDGIARIGRFDGSVGVIKNQTGDFRARIELAH